LHYIFYYISEPSTTLFLCLTSDFRRVLNDVFLLLGDSPESEFYVPTFRNILSVTSSQVV